MRTRLGIAAVFVILLAGCSSSSPTGPNAGGNSPGGDSAELAGEWVLQSGSDDTGNFDLKDSTSTLTLTGGNTGGRTPCNIFGADVTGGVGEIDITPTFQTEAACADPGLMELEPRYLAALEAVTAATVKNESLVLRGGGVELTFSLAPEVPTSKLVGTDWRLESLYAGDAASSVGGNGILFFIDDGTLEGNAGCRDFTGTWEVNDGKITVGALEFADADCPKEFNAQEEHIATVLGDGFTATIEGDRLTVTSLQSDNGIGYRNDASSQA